MIKDSIKILQLRQKIAAARRDPIGTLKRNLGELLRQLAWLLTKQGLKAIIVPLLPYLIPIIIIALVIFLVIIAVGGGKMAQASEMSRGLNVSEQAHQEYLQYEESSYTHETANDHSYKDEYEYRLPWAVLEEIDSNYFKGEEQIVIKDENGQEKTIKRKDFMREAYEALKTEYVREEYKEKEKGDVYITYEWQVDRETRTDPDTGESYTVVVWEGWREIERKEYTRHLIYEAITWEGTFTRNYERKHYIEGKESNPSEGDTYTEKYIWEFQTTGATYDYAKFDTFVKSKSPGIWDSELSLMKQCIYLMLKESPAPDGEIDLGELNFNPDLIFPEGEFVWPVPIEYNEVTCYFGHRKIYYNGEWIETDHTGIDISAPMGTPIYAVKEGKVILARSTDIGGNTVVIDHGVDGSNPPKRVISVYCHLSRFKSFEGQEVKRGDVIGYVGSTGRSTGPHLHFTIKVGEGGQNPVPVNPANFYNIVITGNSRGDPVRYPGNNYGYYEPGLGYYVGPEEMEEYIKNIPNNDKEMDLFIRLVNAEGGGTGDKGIMAVAEVILNRLRSPVFRYSPKNLYTVIYAKNQFEVVSNGAIDKPISSSQYNHIKNLIIKAINEKTNYARGATFFCSFEAGSQNELNFMRVNRVVYNGVQYGNNRFYVPQRR